MTDELELGPDAPPTVELHPHRVHVKGGAIAHDRAKVRTYDPERARKGAKPSGEDVTPARNVTRVLADGSVEVAQLPEVRIPYWLIDSPTATYVGPTHCPDCGLGVRSRGADTICNRLPDDVKTRACHEGCLVACGVKSDG